MGLKTLSSVLDGQPSIHTMPDVPQGEPASAASKPVVDEKPVAGVKPEAAKAKPKAAGQEPEDDHEEVDDGPEESDPVKLRESVAKLKKSLRASRDETRSFKKSRQDEYERRIAELQGQLQAHQRPPQAQAPAPKPEDDEAAYWKDPIGYTRRQKEELQSAFDERLMANKLATSEAYARRAHPDFDEKVKAFAESTKGNQMVRQWLRDQADPAEAVYQAGAKLLLDKEMGTDPNAWREAEREKIRAEEAAKLAAERGNSAPQRPAAPPKSIANARGSGGVSQPTRRGPRSLKEALG